MGTSLFSATAKTFIASLVFKGIRFKVKSNNVKSNKVFAIVVSSPYLIVLIWFSEAVSLKCSGKKLFLEISQNSHENTRARTSFLIKLQEACSFF